MQSDGRIYLIDGNERLEPLAAQDYDSEDLLQRLLAEHPDLLAGDQIDPDSPRRWLLVSREMAVPDDSSGDRWSLDHLFVDQDGVLTLVEVKRSSDTRICREVVGQMLDYAANATVHWPTDRIRPGFEHRCKRADEDPESTLREFLEDDRNADEVDTDRFWERVESNLRAKRIRMLFVADSIPTELRRVVEFLNEVMTPTEVLAIEVRQFVGEGATVLVPRVIGQSEATRRTKQVNVGMDEETFMEAVRACADDGGDAATAVREVLDWSRNAGLGRRFDRRRRGPQCLIGLTGDVTLLHIEEDGRTC